MIKLKVTKKFEDGAEEVKETGGKYSAQMKYAKKNIKKVTVDVPKEDAEAFKDACDKLGVTQAKVLKEVIYATIDKAKK